MLVVSGGDDDDSVQPGPIDRSCSLVFPPSLQMSCFRLHPHGASQSAPHVIAVQSASTGVSDVAVINTCSGGSVVARLQPLPMPSSCCRVLPPGTHWFVAVLHPQSPWQSAPQVMAKQPNGFTGVVDGAVVGCLVVDGVVVDVPVVRMAVVSATIVDVAIVGAKVVGVAVVGEADVGEAVVGEADVGEAVVGEADVGEAVV